MKVGNFGVKENRLVKISYPLEIRWHGRGGQGAVTAAKLLAEWAIDLGKHVQSFPQFGSERRGAPIMAFTRVDEQPITLYNTIQEPNVLIVLDPSLLDIPVTLAGLKEDGLLLVNSPLSPGEIRAMTKIDSGTIATVPATNIAVKHLKKAVTNTSMLGAFLSVTGILELETVLDHIKVKFEKEFPQKIIEGNINAMREAFESVTMDITVMIVRK